MDNNHTYCFLCEKVYPTQESLEFHFDAVRKNGMAKHTMEIKNHKVKKLTSSVSKLTLPFGPS